MPEASPAPEIPETVPEKNKSEVLDFSEPEQEDKKAEEENHFE